jgi:hypothetical protein
MYRTGRAITQSKILLEVIDYWLLRTTKSV